MDYPLEIIISRGGTIGDNLFTSFMAAAVRRKFPNSTITVVVSEFGFIFEGNPVIDKVIEINPVRFENEAKMLGEKADIYFEIRYAVGCSFSARSMKIKSVVDFRKVYEKVHQKYKYIYDQFLNDIPAHDKHNESFYDMALKSCGLDGDINDMYMNLKPENFKKVLKYKGLRFFVLHNMAAKNRLQTKSWSLEHWSKVTQYLKQIGFTPIQASVPGDVPIPGAEQFKGTIFDVATLIKESWGCIAIEGGFAHIAKAVGIDSIVLFGPTTVKFFGYDNNINLRSSTCSPCWWRKNNWFTFCQKMNCTVTRDLPSPCMRDLKEDVVIDAIHKLMERKGLHMEKYIEPNIKMANGQLVASVQAKIRDILIRVSNTPQSNVESEVAKEDCTGYEAYSSIEEKKKNDVILDHIGSRKKVLVIGNDLRLARLLQMQGNTVTLLSNSEIITVKSKYFLKINSVFSPNWELDFSDNSFDRCILPDSFGKQSNMGSFWVELRRILKADGDMIVVLSTRETPLIGDSNQLWSIKAENIENSAIVVNFKKTDS